jgi:hypothetical protein
MVVIFIGSAVILLSEYIRRGAVDGFHRWLAGRTPTPNLLESCIIDGHWLLWFMKWLVLDGRALAGVFCYAEPIS